MLCRLGLWCVPLLIVSLSLGCSRTVLRYDAGDGEPRDRRVKTGFYEVIADYGRGEKRRIAEVIYVRGGDRVGFAREGGVIVALVDGVEVASVDAAGLARVSWQREKRVSTGDGDYLGNTLIAVASIALIVGTVALLIVVAGSDDESFDGR